MKKFIVMIAIALMAFTNTFSYAQTKKDGTPDMRYKANKQAKKPTGPLKKDGTPDMRYKSNNPDAGKKTAPEPAKKSKQ